MKQLRFKNINLQKLADWFTPRRETITIIILLGIVAVLWWVERKW